MKKRTRPTAKEAEKIKYERWRDLPGHLGSYKISQFGRIWSLHSDYITYGSGKKNEYKRFVIHTMTGAKVYIRIHQLVARLFLKNPNNYKEVNHIDGKKSNNYYKNLEWCSRKRNCNHAVEIGLRVPYRKFSNDIIAKIKKSKLTNQELAKMYSINYKYIWAMRAGKVRVLG